MYLWNVTPREPIDIKGVSAGAADQFIRDLTKFYEAFFALNGIDCFRVSAIRYIKPDSIYKDIEVGYRIGPSHLRDVIRGAIYDELKVVARGDGCRFFSFGYDYDSWLCTKHSDLLASDCDGLTISDISDDLIKTDWYDD